MQWAFQLVYTCHEQLKINKDFGYITPAPDKTFSVGKAHDVQVKPKERCEFRSKTLWHQTSHGTTQPSSLHATCQTFGNPKCMTIHIILSLSHGQAWYWVHNSLQSTVDSKAERKFQWNKWLERFEIWTLHFLSFKSLVGLLTSSWRISPYVPPTHLSPTKLERWVGQRSKGTGIVAWFSG